MNLNSVDELVNSGDASPLLRDISQLIESARIQAAYFVNSSMVLLHWKIGQRIYSGVLKEERAEYGEHVIKELSAQLKEHYGRGFVTRALLRMVRFAKLSETTGTY